MRQGEFELILFCMSAFVLVLDGILGRAKVRWYFKVGIPIGADTIVSALPDQVMEAQRIKQPKLFFVPFSKSEIAFRYGMLGNWLVPFVKGAIRTDADGSIRATYQLNWGGSAFLALFAAYLVLEPSRFLFWILHILFVVAMVLLQRFEIKRAFRSCIGGK